HCATKANIMKLSEGLMKCTFEDVAPEYPDITPHHIIIDNCAHQLVINPEQFEVIVTSNMNGDIISDLTSGLVGGLGVAPSSSISATTAIFEPVHGSAPDIAGQDKANPIAMILTAVMLLRHVGQTEIATTVENAVLVTLEEGRTLTGDLARRRAGATAVGTEAFTDAIIANLGRAPSAFGARVTKKLQIPTVACDLKPLRPRELVGVDIFMEARDTADNLGKRLDAAFADSLLTFKVLSNRGTVVYPVPAGQVDTVECWTARFMKPESADSLTDADIVDALQRVAKVALWMHVEKLHVFDGVPGFSRAQGED
ncbi:MAG: isocitrate dehydrogenase, partial [Thermoleophilia bacterium]|nr:isocitrate dehydrogenase [Thermoleophilia bacterium]